MKNLLLHRKSELIHKYPVDNNSMWSEIREKHKRTNPGGSILLLKLTKLTNQTKPKLMKKNTIVSYDFTTYNTTYLC